MYQQRQENVATEAATVIDLVEAEVATGMAVSAADAVSSTTVTVMADSNRVNGSSKITPSGRTNDSSNGT